MRPSHAFYGDTPYPFDLDDVEARDGADDALGLIRDEIGLNPRTRIIDLGCGHGRHAGPLATDGLSVIGVDASRRCLERARARWPGLTTVQADMRQLPFPACSFDAAICLYGSLGMHDTAPAATLREAWRVCTPGATLIIDVAADPPLLTISHERVGGGVGLVVRWRESGRVEQRNLVVRRRGWGIWCLRYARLAPSLEALLERTGWRPVASWGGYDRRPLTDGAPRLVVKAVRQS